MTHVEADAGIPIVRPGQTPQTPATQADHLPFEEEELSGTILQRFALVVNQVPKQAALWKGGEVISYAALDQRANQVANAILAAQPNDAPLVGLLFTQGISPIIAMLGVLKANYGYLMLDAKQPIEYLRQLWADAQSPIILTESAHIKSAHQIVKDDSSIIQLEECRSATSANFTVDPQSTSLMCVIHTSGSTGKPKGVIRDHRFALQTARRNAQVYNIRLGDGIGFPFAWYGGFAAEIIFTSLLNGGILYIYEPQKINMTRQLQEMAAHPLKILYLPVGLFRKFAHALTGQEKWNALSHIILGGDVLYQADVKHCRPYLPQRVIIEHRLGLSEAGIVTQFFIDVNTKLEEQKVPIGYPSADKEILLLDDEGHLLPPDEVGEIAVRSRYISPGYWRNPELTAAKFLPDPEGGDKRIYLTGDLGRMRPDGMLEHLGRKDLMVKIRGFRVELGAIEGALLDYAEIKEAVVVAQEQPNGDKRLVAYLVPSGANVPTVSALRQALSQSLPDVSVPSLFVYLDALPLTPNGKINRRALPEPDNRRPELDTPYVPPRDVYDSQLVALWEEILGINGIGILDDFFELGGHSIALMNLLSQIKAQFGQEIAIATFLQEPTIEQIAAKLQEAAHSEENAGAVTKKQSRVLKLDAESQELVLHYLEGQAIKREPTLKQRLLDYLPFESRVKLFTLFCQRNIVRKNFFRQERELMSRFLEATGLAEHNPSDVMTLYLMRLLCKRFCRGVLARSLSPLPYVRISGEEILTEARQKGKGLLLLGIHTLFPSELLQIIRQHFGYDNLMQYVGVTVLEQNPTLFRALQQYFGDEEEATIAAKFLSGQLDATRRILTAGGIVRMTADGSSGSGTEIKAPVLGRLGSFKTGFAELALRTGATVIPINASIERRGQIKISFQPPLDAGSPTIPHEERVAAFFIR